MELDLFIFYLGTGVIAITFILALLHVKTKKPAYFKYIFWYIILGLLISIWNFLLISKYLLLNNFKQIPQTFLMCLQVLCLGLAFLSERIINKAFFIITFNSLIVIEFLFTILGYFVFKLFDFGTFGNSVSEFIFLVFSFVYFKKILHSLPTKKLQYDPFFWLAVGILFYSACSFPITTLVPLLDYKIPDSLLYKIFSISNMSLIVLYLFICKAYLCLKHQIDS
jgi:hypothetical protein